MKETTVLIFYIFIVGFFLGLAIGSYGRQGQMRKEAIGMGAARYSFNETNGVIKFEWIKN